MNITKIITANLLLIILLLALMIYPLRPEINVKEKEVEFRWIAIYKNYTLYVDDNEEFTSPMVIRTERRSYPVNLEPGTYFYMISSGRISSRLKRLEVKSEVATKVDNSTLKNDGNVDLNVSINSLTGAVVAKLPYKDNMEIEKGSNITAGGIIR